MKAVALAISLLLTLQGAVSAQQLSPEAEPAGEAAPVEAAKEQPPPPANAAPAPVSPAAPESVAGTALPFTRRLAWSKDIPNLYRWGLRYCTMESMANWHTMVPGNYVISRLLWDVDADPQAMLDEFYPLYYGPAGEAMRRYNTFLENAYENSGAYAGCLWSMHRILTPEVMWRLEAALSEAKERARGDALVERRVQIAEHSMQYARGWFAARDALNRFDLAEAEIGVGGGAGHRKSSFVDRTIARRAQGRYLSALSGLRRLQMPELPEVETVRRGLQPAMEGARFTHVEATAGVRLYRWVEAEADRRIDRGQAR